MVYDVKKHYTELAEEYDKKLNLYCQKRFLKIIGGYAKGKILDIGCGTGYAQRDLGKAVIGLDLTYALLKLNKSKCICGNALIMPFKNDSFDAVYSINAIEHVKDTNKLVKECRRVLKKNGVLILITPNKGMEFVLYVAEKLKLKIPEGEHRFLSFDELQNLARKNGMRIISANKFVLFPLHVRMLNSFFENLEPFFQSFCLFLCMVCKKRKKR